LTARARDSGAAGLPKSFDWCRTTQSYLMLEYHQTIQTSIHLLYRVNPIVIFNIKMFQYVQLMYYYNMLFILILYN